MNRSKLAQVGKELEEKNAYNPKTKTWDFKTDPTDSLAGKLSDKGVGEEPGSGELDAENVERRSVREREAQRPDNRGSREDSIGLVDKSTAELLKRGKDFRNSAAFLLQLAILS